MAVLNSAIRQKVTNGLMRYWSSLFETVTGINKLDLRVTVDAADDWIDTNSAAYNAALPTAARDNLTATQKTLLFTAVALARVSVPLLKRVFGEVD